MTENESKNLLEQLNSDFSENDYGSLFEELKKGDSPTSDLTPTPSFVNNVLAGIGTKAAVSSAVGSAALAASSSVASGAGAGSAACASVSAASSFSVTSKIIAGALATMAAAGIMAYAALDKDAVSALRGQKTEEAKKSVIEAEIKQLKESESANKTPVLNFGSPSEDVE